VIVLNQRENSLDGYTQLVDRESTCLLWFGAILLLVPRSGNAMSALHQHPVASTSSRPFFGRLIASKPFWGVNNNQSRYPSRVEGDLASRVND
jgi:hypothetical protein